MDIPIPLQEALRDSITSGTFIDTKFWVFSKRNSKAGRIGEPKALFVNGHVVRSVPRLGALLDRKETKENLRTRFPTDRKPYTGDYDYDTDSDLEEDDWGSSDVEDPRVVAEKGKNDKSDTNTLVGGQDSDGKGNESLDIISVSDVDSLFSDSADTKIEAGVAATPTLTHTGTVVVIEDVGFVTFQALLRYLYTNEIDFAPWGSAERRKVRAQEETTEPYETPKPSPKSIYRLADKYGIPKLKRLALQQIQRDLCKCDIVDELFSKYTSRYPELRKLEMGQLARELLSTDPSPVLHALKDKIRASTRGELPHANDILPTLYELMQKNEAPKETPTQPSTPSKKDIAGRDWKGLKNALTWSLSSGSFLDSQFYALDSKLHAGASTIRPIYFCSMVGGAFLPRLVKYSSRIWPCSKTPPQCVDDYDSDLDDQVSGTEVSADAYPRPTRIPEDPLSTYKAAAPALVLKSGTTKTWGAIFFYVYTSRVGFAPIRSRCITKTTEIKNETSDSPPPVSKPPSPLKTAVAEACSPKSAYALASKIGLKCLCDLAFDNIKSQLNEKNIVQEFFSPFTADHESIRQMEHELFYSKLGPLVEGSSLLEVIRGSSSGENSHRAAALELFFERSVQEYREGVAAGAKKPKTQPLPPDPSVTDKKPEAVKPTQKGTQKEAIPVAGPWGRGWLLSDPPFVGDSDPTNRAPRPTQGTRTSMASAWGSSSSS